MTLSLAGVPDANLLSVRIAAKQKLSASRSDELNAEFCKAEGGLNNKIVELEQVSYRRGVRWLVARRDFFKSEGDVSTWGCSACFQLISSVAWVGAKTNRLIALPSGNLTSAKLVATWASEMCNMEYHVDSLLHQVALNWLVACCPAFLSALILSETIATERHANGHAKSC